MCGASLMAQWLKNKTKQNKTKNLSIAGDTGSIPRLETLFGEGNGNPLQYSSPEKPMDREAWQPIVHGVAKE